LFCGFYGACGRIGWGKFSGNTARPCKTHRGTRYMLHASHPHASHTHACTYACRHVVRSRELSRRSFPALIVSPKSHIPVFVFILPSCTEQTLTSHVFFYPLYSLRYPSCGLIPRSRSLFLNFLDLFPDANPNPNPNPNTIPIDLSPTIHIYIHISTIHKSYSQHMSCPRRGHRLFGTGFP